MPWSLIILTVFMIGGVTTALSVIVTGTDSVSMATKVMVPAVLLGIAGIVITIGLFGGDDND